MKYAAHALALALLSSGPVTAQSQRAGDRVQFMSDLRVEAGETVRDVVCMGCSIQMLGTATGDAVAIFGSIEVHGPVDGDTVAIGGNISLGAAAKVGHDVVSIGGRISRDPQATIGGEVTSTPGPPPVTIGQLLLLCLAAWALLNLVLVLLSYLIAGERRVETVATTVRERAGLALLAGLGVLVASVILFIISALLGPLMPVLALLVVLALFVTLLVGYTGLSSWMGRSLVRTAGPLVAVLVGALLITILQWIPLLGILLFLAFFLLALGSAAVSGLGTDANWLPQQFAGRPTAPPSPPASLR